MWTKLYRKLKLEYYKLIRMKGAPSFVARGFSVGIFVEFITLPTFGLAFLLLFPLIRLFRASLPAGLIAFVIGKLVLPIFMVINYNIGYALVGKPLQHPTDPHQAAWREWLVWMQDKGLAYFTGSAVMGLFVAFASYFLVHGALQLYRRKKGRRSLSQSRTSP
ncbi:DUF2062 domain-containing protein [Brevibacillus agri]|uniref:DUF2062 domain-containing protein n=1 Tax=Brevibacillus agri TaxID=51101 RepID=UPI002867C163|nr:DUF2062 domain-containing protein [Brevibacillus agri]MED1822580.1 DUF2062 domain-containing protein [Brevibacillus agri]